MVSPAISILSPDNNLYPLDSFSVAFPNLPFLFSSGNIDLLQLPLTALFCSRKCPGDAILKAYDLARELREKETPVISGFHTPVEKDMLEILLKGKGPIVICPARGLGGMRIAPAVNEGVKQGRILFISIASQQEKRITQELAEERNFLVAALATKWEFVYTEPGGHLEKMKSQIASVVAQKTENKTARVS